MPQVTTIIPTYNRSSLLKRAITSVQKQTFRDLKVSVFDNASPDETESVVKGLMKEDPRIHYTRHQTNIGGCQNFLFGLKQVSTPYFSFLSDDDVLFPEFYETAIHALESTPRAGFFVGLTLSCTPDGKVCNVPLEKWAREGLYESEEGFITMAEHLPIWTGVLFRKEVVDKIGLLDPQVDAIIDFDYMLKAAAHFPFIISKKRCAIFLCHTGSVSSQVNMENQEGWKSFERNILGIKTLSDATIRKALDTIRASKEKYIRTCLKQTLKTKKFEEFVSCFKAASFLTRKEKNHFLLRKFLAQRMPFVDAIWSGYKRVRRKLKMRKYSKLELLETKYGNYSQWLQI